MNSVVFGGPAGAPTIPDFDMEKPVPYSTACQRVARHRGRPSVYNCAICLGDAEVWSYRGHSKHEQTGPMPQAGRGGVQVLRWSPDPMDYIPLCRECRQRRSKNRAEAARGTEQ